LAAIGLVCAERNPAWIKNDKNPFVGIGENSPFLFLLDNLDTAFFFPVGPVGVESEVLPSVFAKLFLFFRPSGGAFVCENLNFGASPGSARLPTEIGWEKKKKNRLWALVGLLIFGDSAQGGARRFLVSSWGKAGCYDLRIRRVAAPLGCVGF